MRFVRAAIWIAALACLIGVVWLPQVWLQLILTSALLAAAGIIAALVREY